MSKNLAGEPGGVQRGTWIRKTVQNPRFVRFLLEVILACLGYSETELFRFRLLDLPRAALGLPGEPQEPFRLHFGYIFGAISGPASKKGEKVKIELSPWRELNFGGPGRPRKR